jgi:hypothetical protein
MEMHHFLLLKASAHYKKQEEFTQACKNKQMNITFEQETDRT